MTPMNLQFQQACKKSVPLMAVQTSDQTATIANLMEGIDGVSFVAWDLLNGFYGLNEAGLAAVSKIQDASMRYTDPTIALKFALEFSAKTVIFAKNFSRIFSLDAKTVAEIVQGVANLRDEFRGNRRAFVMLGLSFILPSELKSDVVLLDEPLPTAEQLQSILMEILESAKADAEGKGVNFPMPDANAQERVIDALRGLSSFAAEQALAMSVTLEGLNVDTVRQAKYSQINQQKGLTIYKGTESFSSIGGCDWIKTTLTRRFNGPRRPKVVVFIDEIEKHFAGVGGDNSGVSDEMHGAFLTWTQDRRVMGNMFIGPPGAAKSAIAKAVANEFDVPLIVLDFSGLKEGIVGSTNQNLREAFKTIDAIADKDILMLATCNGLGNMSPELLRRFTQQYMFDLPTPDERAKIWPIYAELYGVDVSGAGKEFSDDLWTGAEIAKCCDEAYAQGITLKEAATCIIPVAVSQRRRIEALRREADGTYISAAKEGVYTYENTQESVPVETLKPNTGKRELSL